MGGNDGGNDGQGGREGGFFFFQLVFYFPRGGVFAVYILYIHRCFFFFVFPCFLFQHLFPTTFSRGIRDILPLHFPQIHSPAPLSHIPTQPNRLVVSFRFLFVFPSSFSFSYGFGI